MAEYNWYVNKSGNDSNGGTSHGDAFLTIQAAIDQATDAFSDNHIINIGSGEWNEGDFSAPAGGIVHPYFTIQGDGYTVLDGTGFTSYTSWNSGPKIVEVKDCIIRNWGSPSTPGNAWFLGTGVANFAQNLYATIEDCIIEDCDTVIRHQSGAGALYNDQMNRCFVRNVNRVFWNPAGDTNARWFNNVFFNCSYIWLCTVFNAFGYDERIYGDSGNIYINVGTVYQTGSRYRSGEHWQFSGSTGPWGNNIYWGVDRYARLYTTNYDTYSSFIAVTTAQGKSYAGSMETDPSASGLNDGTHVFDKFDYDVTTYGIGTSGIADGANSYRATWQAEDSLAATSGTGWVPTGDIVYSSGAFRGTDGTLTSPVYDLGAVYGFGKFYFPATDTYPSGVMDTDSGDTAPNRRNFEYRTSNAFFAQNAGSPAWVTQEQWGEITGAASGRYVQTRLTFRDDGVEA